MLDECYDLELYNWTRVDIADPVRPRRRRHRAPAMRWQPSRPASLVDSPFLAMGELAECRC